VHDLSDRFEGIDTTTLITGSPFIVGGIAYVDCRVGHVYPLENTSVFIGDVVAAWYSENNNPLIYHNRSYHKLE
jgi:flavin reductase (DIM6/NTAB) family NADH-FMN oxidoreductase RutF